MILLAISKMVPLVGMIVFMFSGLTMVIVTEQPKKKGWVITVMVIIMLIVINWVFKHSPHQV